MDIDYKEVIDFSCIKELIQSKGMKVKFVAEKCGQRSERLSQIIRNANFPKTDIICKIAWALNVPVSEVVKFKGIECNEQKKKWFEVHALPYQPESDATGEVTYEPLRAMIGMYLDYLFENTGKEKTINDVYDLIVPYRVRNNIADGTQKALEARGIEKKTERIVKGLTADTRSKIKADRSLGIRTIYDICNFFGCSIDWVLSYK